MHTKYNKYYTRQVDEQDCGVAALSMVLKNYNSEYTLAYLRQKAKTDMDGTTISGILDASYAVGLKAKAYQADMSVFKMEDIAYPFVVHVLKKQELHHYYTIFFSKEDELIIGDPDPEVGIVKVSKECFKREWQGECIFFEPKKSYTPYKGRQYILKKYIDLLKNEKKLIKEIVLAALVTTIITVFGSYFLQFVIDDLIPKDRYSLITVTSISLMVAYAVHSSISYIQRILVTVFGQRLSIKINLDYIDHLLKLPMSFFTTRRLGDITSRFNDAGSIIDALGSIVLSVFLDFGMIMIIGVVLFLKNTNLFVITMLSLPIYIIIILRFSKKIDSLNTKTMEDNSDLNSLIIENLKGIESVKALNNEIYSYRKIEYSFNNLLTHNLSLSKINEMQNALKAGTELIFQVIIVWSGALLVMKGKMSVGELMAYVTLSSFLIDPMLNIINLQPKLQRAKVANERLDEVYSVPIEDDSQRKISKLEDIQGNILMENLSFDYGYGSNILSKLNLKIEEQQKLVIVGMSGSGKTTLAKLLLGFYDLPNDIGTIKFNGIDIRDISLTLLRRYITYVPQTPYIFSGTVRDNLTLGKNTSEKDVQKALEVADIKIDIDKFPLGVDTRLSEEGNSLSTGQKQRLSIARAILTSSKVIIFDETTSNLDAITENRIISNLMGIKDRTMIFIAHRLSVAQQVNNIIVLDQGEIVEQGSHEQLLESKNFYYKLVNQNNKTNLVSDTTKKQGQSKR